MSQEVHPGSLKTQTKSVVCWTSVTLSARVCEISCQTLKQQKLADPSLAAATSALSIDLVIRHQFLEEDTVFSMFYSAFARGGMGHKF